MLFGAIFHAVTTSTKATITSTPTTPTKAKIAATTAKGKIRKLRHYKQKGQNQQQ